MYVDKVAVYRHSDVERCGWLAEIDQERRNNQKHDGEWSIHDHAAAIFNMSPRVQFLRFGNTTSAVLLRQLNLGSQQKISVIGGNLWNNEIPSIVPNHRYFSRRSETWLLRKHRRSSVAESQKLSLVANVKDYHAHNDRLGPFQPEIILIEYLVHM